MSKRNKMKQNKNKKRSALSYKYVGNKEVILVDEAVDYVKKLGYKVELPYMEVVARVFFILAIGLVVGTLFTNGVRADTYKDCSIYGLCNKSVSTTAINETNYYNVSSIALNSVLTVNNSAPNKDMSIRTIIAKNGLINALTSLAISTNYIESPNICYSDDTNCTQHNLYDILLNGNNANGLGIYGLSILYSDSTINKSVDVDNHLLYSDNGKVSMDYGDYALFDQSEQVSIIFDNRQLSSAIGVIPSLDWSNDNEIYIAKNLTVDGNVTGPNLCYITGNCPTGNSTFNESLTDSKYYLKSNPNSYLNSSQIEKVYPKYNHSIVYLNSSLNTTSSDKLTYDNGEINLYVNDFSNTRGITITDESTGTCFRLGNKDQEGGGSTDFSIQTCDETQTLLRYSNQDGTVFFGDSSVIVDLDGTNARLTGGGTYNQKVMCYADAQGTLGHCTSVVGVTGGCTCVTN